MNIKKKFMSYYRTKVPALYDGGCYRLFVDKVIIGY